jgi:hypothetical protein
MGKFQLISSIGNPRKNLSNQINSVSSQLPSFLKSTSPRPQTRKYTHKQKRNSKIKKLEKLKKKIIFLIEFNLTRKKNKFL